MRTLKWESSSGQLANKSLALLERERVVEHDRAWDYQFVRERWTARTTVSTGLLVLFRFAGNTHLGKLWS